MRKLGAVGLAVQSISAQQQGWNRQPEKSHSPRTVQKRSSTMKGGADVQKGVNCSAPSLFLNVTWNKMGLIFKILPISSNALDLDRLGKTIDSAAPSSAGILLGAVTLPCQNTLVNEEYFGD